MTQVTVRAALPIAGINNGETTVEETDYVKRLIADGKLTLISRHPDVDDAPEREPVVGARQDGWRVEPGEFDATHGEAGPLTDPSRFDPEPGDPDFDEYDSAIDREVSGG